MTGFLRANDTRAISPEESKSYVKMRGDIRRFTVRARGSYTPPDRVRPKDELDLDEIRKLAGMLILRREDVHEGNGRAYFNPSDFASCCAFLLP